MARSQRQGDLLGVSLWEVTQEVSEVTRGLQEQKLHAGRVAGLQEQRRPQQQRAGGRPHWASCRAPGGCHLLLWRSPGAGSAGGMASEVPRWARALCRGGVGQKGAKEEDKVGI